MRILIVEDEELIAQSIHDSLAAEGYAVDRATDGVDGLFDCQHGALHRTCGVTGNDFEESWQTQWGKIDYDPVQTLR